MNGLVFGCFVKMYILMLCLSKKEFKKRNQTNSWKDVTCSL